MSDAPDETEALPPDFSPNRERAKRLLELGIVLAMLGCTAAIMIRNVQASRQRGRRGPRACYANQKTVVGAIEMYNLDKNTKRTVLDESFFTALRSGGYLQSLPQDPGEGPDSWSHYQTTGTGNGIRCVQHGSIE